MNKVCLVGRLTRDVDLKYVNEVTIGRFTIAVNRPTKKEGQPDADFLPIVVFGKLAENCAKYIGKGRLISVSGRLQSRSWDDQDGKRHYGLDVIGEEVKFLDKAKEEEPDFVPADEEDDLPF